jgi:hypothetical protein
MMFDIIDSPQSRDTVRGRDNLRYTHGEVGAVLSAEDNEIVTRAGPAR